MSGSGSGTGSGNDKSVIYLSWSITKRWNKEEPDMVASKPMLDDGSIHLHT